MTLPTGVVEKDRTLQKATDDLAKLRWHWTLDESNPDRVSLREYARQVGSAFAAVHAMANGYAAWFKTQGDHEHVITPGQPQTVGDHVELAKMGAERQEAVKAIAKTTGAAITTVTTHKREEVNDVVNTARERAVDRGTTVEHEIERAAEQRERARKTDARLKSENKAGHTMRYVEIEGDLGAAMQRLRKILNIAQDVDFTDEERELIVESLAKMRALLGLIDLRIAGETQVDWDAEMQKLEVS